MNLSKVKQAKFTRDLKCIKMLFNVILILYSLNNRTIVIMNFITRAYDKKINVTVNNETRFQT